MVCRSYLPWWSSGQVNVGFRLWFARPIDESLPIQLFPGDQFRTATIHHQLRLLPRKT